MGAVKKKCKICNHKRVAQINSKMLNQASLSSLEKLYSVSRATLRKHRDNCLPAILADDNKIKDAITGDVLIKQVYDTIALVRKLYTACDDYLTDPDDKDKYFLGPRGHEIEVLYSDYNDKGNPDRVQKKADIQQLLDSLDGKYVIRNVTVKHADPRDLLLKGIGKLQDTVKMIQSSTQNLIEWEHKKRALDKIANEGAAMVTVQEEVAIITKRVTIALGIDTDDLMKKAGMPNLED